MSAHPVVAFGQASQRMGTGANPYGLRSSRSHMNVHVYQRVIACFRRASYRLRLLTIVLAALTALTALSGYDIWRSMVLDWYQWSFVICTFTGWLSFTVLAWYNANKARRKELDAEADAFYRQQAEEHYAATFGLPAPPAVVFYDPQGIETEDEIAQRMQRSYYAAIADQDWLEAKSCAEILEAYYRSINDPIAHTWGQCAHAMQQMMERERQQEADAQIREQQRLAQSN